MVTIVKVRRELAPMRSHLHVVGVADLDGRYYPLAEVLEGQAQGELWYVRKPSSIYASDPSLCAVDRCSYPNCTFGPYIVIVGPRGNQANLLLLPPC